MDDLHHRVLWQTEKCSDTVLRCVGESCSTNDGDVTVTDKLRRGRHCPFPKTALK